MPKIRILRGTVANGKRVYVGDIVEVSVNEAKMFIGYKKGEYVNEIEEPKILTTESIEEVIEKPKKEKVVKEPKIKRTPRPRKKKQ